MILSETQKQKLITECRFSSTRSSGPGGQNVNKVNTKVELRFNINQSEIFSDNQKTILNIKLKNRINSEGEFVLTSQISRSQLKNKQLGINLFFQLIESSLKQPKKRIHTKPTKASIKKRLDTKHKISDKKANRKRLDE